MRTPYAHPPIGVDLGAHAIRAVQRDASGAVAASAVLVRPNPDAPLDAADFERLCGVLYRQGFRGRHAHVSAPKALITRTTIELPPRDSGAPLDQIARTELARQAKSEPGAFEFAWWDAPQPPRHAVATRAITVACRHESALALLASLEAAGLRVDGLFSPSTAAAASLPRPAPGATAAVLDVGWTDTTLVVVGRDDIVFERQLSSCGIAHAVTRAAKRRGLKPADLAHALAREGDAQAPHAAVADVIELLLHDLEDEVRSSIDYLRGCDGHPVPDTLNVIGGGASLRGLTSAATRAAGLPPGPADPDAPPAMAAAAGLASLHARCAIREAA